MSGGAVLSGPRGTTYFSVDSLPHWWPRDGTVVASWSGDQKVGRKQTSQEAADGTWRVGEVKLCFYISRPRGDETPNSEPPSTVSHNIYRVSSAIKFLVYMIAGHAWDLYPEVCLPKQTMIRGKPGTSHRPLAKL